jgi:zinc/manganese transport system substrate-binding protein
MPNVLRSHAQWAYILTRFGLVQVGTVEERPGIPPTPAHLAKLIQLMKDDKVK